MAILKDTVVSGSLRATDTVYADTIQAKTIEAPTDSNETTYGPGTSGQVLKSNGSSVYWASDDNSDTKVTQTATTTNAAYEVLFSATADNTTRTEAARKTSTLTYNPSTKALVTGGTVDGYDLNAASAKAVDTSIAAASTSTNLPTSKAVATFVEGKGYVTSSGVTKVSTGAGLTGGDITTTGTVKANLTSETKLTNAAADGTETSGRVYPVRLDKNGKLAVNVPWTNTNSSYLTAHQTIKQDGVTGATANRFGTCSTAAGTAAKTVSITTGTFNLEAGARVSVHFSNANTANSPTLNVNSKGAKNIFHNGAQITNGNNKKLLAGVVDFIYDGTQWHLVGNYIDTDEDTYRVIQVDGTQIASASSASRLNFVSGSNVSITGTTTGNITIAATDTTYENKAAASGGTAVSLVTTGEKYTWNNKSNLAIGTTASTAAAGNHTHSAATTNAAGFMSTADKTKLNAMGNAAIFYGTCDTAAATVAKVVTCADFTSADLVKGAIIYVTFTNTNSGARADLTMNVNSTGAKPLRELRNGAVSQLPGNDYLVKNQTYMFTYDGTNWCALMNYDANTTLIHNFVSGGLYTADSVIYRYQFLVKTANGQLSPFNNVSNGYENTSKAMLTSVEFDPMAGVFYWATTTTINADARVTPDYISSHNWVDTRYSFNTTTSSLTKAQPLYIKCTPTSNGMVKLASASPLVQKLPGSPDGYWYILLGATYNKYCVELDEHNAVYTYAGGPDLAKAEPRPIVKYGPSAAFSSLPVTFGNASITPDMVVLNYVLSNPTAQINNWTVTTAAGSLTISGQVRGSTTITLYLGRCEQEA